MPANQGEQNNQENVTRSPREGGSLGARAGAGRGTPAATLALR